MNLFFIAIGLLFVATVLIFTSDPSSRTSTKYKMWRLAVLRRDNFTCRKCGKKGGYLEAHHLKSWASLPEARFSVSNGQTLCLPCHQQTDSYKYWKSKNN